ncbi:MULTISPECIES: DUF6251 family protein [Streptomyces]|uniref:DUF6251 family protein n=1 Tax=Streptomyces TaxID=1883 RepID=UPI000B9E4531|nr:DUF6251 family protein [Streptomyces kasugaensis]
MTTPRRYQFDNHLPAPRQETPLPLYQPQPIPSPAAYDDGRPIVVQHIHQAPPDRTVQRVALGAGVGGGAVAAGVYFGPLLVAAVSSMAISLGVLALVVTVLVWGAVTVVRSVGGPDGKAAAQTLAKARRRH